MTRNNNLAGGGKSAEVNLGRHQRYCTVCKHEQREEIEAAFVAWRSPASLAEEFGLQIAPASIGMPMRLGCSRSGNETSGRPWRELSRRQAKWM